MSDKPAQSSSSSKASLSSGVNGLVTLSSTVTQSPSLAVAVTTTTMATPSLLAAATSSSAGSLVGLSSTTTQHVAVTTQSSSSFAAPSLSSQQQYKLQQQQLEMQLKQQQQQLAAAAAAAAAADAETKRLFANGTPHIMQVCHIKCLPVRISPPRFLDKCPDSFVLLYFESFAFWGLCLVCLYF